MDTSDICKYESLFELQNTIDIKTLDTDSEHVRDVVICKDCTVPAVTHGRSTWECPKCGSIVDELIDTTAEWRLYPEGGKSENAVRCSAIVNNLLPQSSKGTIILSGNNSNYNQRRTQKVHSWSAMTYKERCLNNIFQDISLRSLNGCILGNVTKLAHEYYKTVSELYVARGVMRKGLIAACLFMACKNKVCHVRVKKSQKYFRLATNG